MLTEIQKQKIVEQNIEWMKKIGIFDLYNGEVHIYVDFQGKFKNAKITVNK